MSNKPDHTPTETKPSLPRRPRNAETTRVDILSAAERCFAEDSYEAVGLRKIAAAAGINASLIIRYFGSKEELFAEVLRKSSEEFDMKAILEVEESRLGEALARMILSPEARRHVLLYLRSSVSATAAPIFSEIMQQTFSKPLAEKLKVDDAELRADLINAILIGSANAYYLVGFRAMAQTGVEKIVADIASVLQSYIDRPSGS